MRTLGSALSLSLAAMFCLVASCSTSESTDSGDDRAGEGGEGPSPSAGSGGREPAAGAGGDENQGGDPSGVEGGAGGAAGAIGDVGGAGAGGSGDCADAETLPRNIEVDTTVGPGCVRLNRTTLGEAAVLTIAPGTTVLVEPAGFLSVGDGDNSAVVAVGTAAQPIRFTSAAADPEPGDWQCVFIGSGSSATELDHVVFEYGGAPCAAVGSGPETVLDVHAGVRSLTNLTITDSSSHAITIYAEASVRAFQNNTFARNELASLVVHAKEIPTLEVPNTFEDADDYIDVDTTFPIDGSGDWVAQGVPFRVTGRLGLNPGAAITVGPGVRIEMSGSSIDAFDAEFNIEGTEEEPVVITSARPSPLAGDWGCLLYSNTTVTPSINHAVFEYAGNGQGCSGAAYKAALVVPETARITNTTFREIEGYAVRSSECDTTEWCTNTFEAVELGPLQCGASAVATTCP